MSAAPTRHSKVLAGMVVLAIAIYVVRYLVPLLVLGAMFAFITPHAFGHDSWINSQGRKNAAGEWCCGEHDCEILPARQVSARQNGYKIWFIVGEGEGTMKVETVPYEEAQPSPDGLYWRCHDAYGKRRCFFAPPPNT